MLTRLLYVDDEPMLLDLAKTYIGRKGYDVTTVVGAEEALRILENDSFDAIISDYQMPGMDGIGFLSTLRERGDDTPFIIFTGRGREEVIIEALNLGADFYLQKGGEPKSQFAELLNTVDHLVRSRGVKKDLELSEWRFQKTLSIIPDLVSIHSADMDILYSNWKGIADVPAERRIMGSKCYRTYRGFEEICPDCKAKEVLVTKEPFTTEAELEDGTWIELRVLPISFDEDGEVEMFVEWVKDITLQKSGERDSIQDKRLLEAIIDNIEDIIGIQYPDKSVYRYNRAGYEALGMGQDEVEGKKCYELIGRSEECEICATREALRIKGRAEVDKYVPEMGIHLNCRSSSILDDDGEVVLMIEQLRDISEVERAKEELRDSEAKYRMFADHTSDILWSTDVDGAFTYVSPSVIKLSEYDIQNLLGRRLVDLMHPDDRPEGEEALARMHATGVPVQDVEIRFTHPDGEWHWYSVSISPIHSDDGEYQGMIGVSRNVDQKVRAQQELRRAKRQLELMAKFSHHDITNKAMAARGFLSILDEAPLDDETRSHLSKVRHSLDGILSNVEFARMFEGIGSSEPRWINLEDVIASLGDIKGLTIASELGGLEIHADIMLDKVFENLLDNTLRHGGDVTQVRVRWESTDDAAVVIWEDDGSGVAEKDKERIFSQGYGSNTGLGLFLTREVLSITGIAIHECGVPGEGVRFEMRVPKKGYRINAVRASKAPSSH